MGTPEVALLRAALTISTGAGGVTGSGGRMREGWGMERFQRVNCAARWVVGGDLAEQREMGLK